MNIFNQDETTFLKNLSSLSSTHQYQSITSDDISNLDDDTIIAVKTAENAYDEIGTDGCNSQINSIQSTKYPIKFISWRFFYIFVIAVMLMFSINAYYRLKRTSKYFI
jgi:hypothetical protein